MRPFSCTCGNAVFFENTACVACHREVGWCPVCRQIVALEPDPDAVDGTRCGNLACGAALRKCHNYATEQVCNRCIPATDDTSPLCDGCRLNHIIPDLSVEGNREKWARLEAAKRRLLYTIDLLGLPYGTAEDGVDPPLSFDFKADIGPADAGWEMGPTERVFTGHADGRITINLREADEVAREKARVYHQEAHRTLIGHFRHEIGHYYWQMLVQGVRDEEFARVFGDPDDPTYAEAQQAYYDSEPPPDWQERFISVYATMHPWEDFAESFGTYLDMVSVLDTAVQMGVGHVHPPDASLEDMVRAYAGLGVVLNEMNRAMGLLDLTPEVFTEPVVAKLAFVDDVVRSERAPARAANEGGAVA